MCRMQIGCSDTCFCFDCTREPSPLDPEKAGDEPTPERLILDGESEPEPELEPEPTSTVGTKGHGTPHFRNYSLPYPESWK
jgi:hypothetical protein